MAIGCDVDYPIHISDQENMIDLMRKNVKLNGLESRVIGLVLNWCVLLFDWLLPEVFP